MHRYDLIKSHTKHINAFKRHFIWLTFFAWDKRIPRAPAMMPRKCPAKPVKNFIHIICQNATFIIRPEKNVARKRQKFLPRALIAVIQPDQCRSFNCAILSSGFISFLSGIILRFVDFVLACSFTDGFHSWIKCSRTVGLKRPEVYSL